MAIGATLAEMLIGVRAEAMQSVSPGLAKNVEAVYTETLQRMQRQLWLDHAWPHLRVDRDTALAAGQRYYDFPADLEMDRVEQVMVKWGGRWRETVRGIGPEHLNAYDSDLDVRADPVMRWNPHDGGQVEVWPVPASDSQVVRMRGIRALRPLVDPADTADLDRDLLVLFTAAEIVAESKSPRAQAVAQRAQQHYAKLRQRGNANDSGMFVLGGRPAGHAHPARRPILVAVDRGN